MPITSTCETLSSTVFTAIVLTVSCRLRRNPPSCCAVVIWSLDVWVVVVIWSLELIVCSLDEMVVGVI